MGGEGCGGGGVLGVGVCVDGGEAKRPPTSFSPVTATNVRLSPQNFSTFSFSLFATLV